MNNAMWCCQNLRKSDSTTKEDHHWLKRTMAYLAVQVQTYSFRWGIEDVSLGELAGFCRANSQQSLDSECVEFGVPSCPRRDNQKTAGNTDYLPMQIQYAGILVQVRRMLHDRDIRPSSKSEMEALSYRLREQLESWMQRMPLSVLDHNLPSPKHTHQRRTYLHLSMQYYELLLALDSTSLFIASSALGQIVDHSQAHDRCVRTVRSILKHCEGLQTSDMHIDRYLPTNPQVES
jgi:hypothetical protein